MKFNVISCYALAWRSFSKWWIPLCLISGTIVALEIVPRVLVRADVNEFMAVVHTIVDSITQSDLGQLENALLKAQAQMFQLIRKVAVLGLYIFPFVALLTVILLMYANWAVKNRQEAVETVLKMVLES